MDGWMAGRKEGMKKRREGRKEGLKGRIFMFPGGIMEGKITVTSIIVWVPVIHGSKTFYLQCHF